MPALCFGYVTDTVKTVLTCFRLCKHCHQGKKVCCLLLKSFFKQDNSICHSNSIRLGGLTQRSICVFSSLFFLFYRLALCPSLPAFCLLHSKGPLNVTYGRANKQIHINTHRHTAMHTETRLYDHESMQTEIHTPLVFEQVSNHGS